jgi:signal transduction histidine kinase
VTLHPLLVRLLRKAGAAPDAAPSLEAWQELLARVSRTYQEADQDRYTLERSIEISGREMQGLYQNIKRQSDAVIRATLEAANAAIIVVDRARRVVAANRQFREMWNVDDELIAAGNHRAVLARVVAQDRDPEISLARIDRIHDSMDTIRRELTLRDGRVLDLFSAPVRLPDGTFVARVTFFVDCTAERRAAQQIERAREAAEAASRAKSMFLANMSHELRTPLNAVIGLADLLLVGRDPITARQREYLESILASGRHLLDLVNDVLDLAKVEAGKHALELEPVAARDAIVEAVAALEPLALQRGVALTNDVAADAPPVRADRRSLRQILYNLISNALKFTDRDGRVQVSAVARDGHVAIAVADTGIGIAPEQLPRLYRAFEQLDLPTGERPEGTGLGLALTKRLVELHGGTIHVTSRLGEGTTFTVRMPTFPEGHPA